MIVPLVAKNHTPVINWINVIAKVIIIIIIIITTTTTTTIYNAHIVKH